MKSRFEAIHCSAVHALCLTGEAQTAIHKQENV